ncbi:MAG: hypothetical protein JWM16_129 [Verrucomicrobiales bacterium]|nr:hypothetical protein [Verrucomicrobiales bacterium]
MLAGNAEGYAKPNCNQAPKGNMNQGKRKQAPAATLRKNHHRQSHTRTLATILAGLLAIVCPSPVTAVIPAIQISEDTLPGVGDSEADTEAEPHIAVDPNNASIVVAAFQVGRFLTFGGSVGIGFATSHDGGQTWTSGNLQGLTAAASGEFARASDPVVAFGPDGAVYISTLLADLPDQTGCMDAIAVQRSDDGGLTWNAPTFVAIDSCSPTRELSLDKEWIAVDNFSASPHFGRIYVAFDGGFGITLSFSDDRGQTWISPRTVGGGFFPFLLVQPNGDVTILGKRGDEFSITSHDGGLTFDALVTIEIYRGSELSDMRAGGVGNPAGAVDPVTGDLYAVWQDRRFRTNGLNDIVLSRSSDGGQTWGALVRVNPDDPDGHLAHFTPAVTAKYGLVHVSYRTRDVSAGLGGSFVVDARYILSTDRGSTFSGEQQIGDPSDLHFVALTDAEQGGGPKFYGDYMGIAVTSDFAFPVWCRSFAESSSSATHHQSTWISRVPVPCVLVCPPDITVSNDLGQCSAVVTYPPPTSSGSCTGTCTPASGTAFPVGTNTVTCAASSGIDCSFTITVVDAEPPAISCPSNQTVEFTSISGAPVTYAPPTVTDNCPGATAACTPPAGSTFPIGTTTVHCVASDPSGNTTSCDFTIVVLGPLGVKRDVVNDLTALRATISSKNDGRELDDAIGYLAESIDPTLWLDQIHVEPKHGQRAFQEEMQSVHELVELIQHNSSLIPTATLQGFIDRIVKSDHLLALIAINEAVAAGVNPRKVADAQWHFDEAEVSVSQGNFEQATHQYREAWMRTLHATIKSLRLLARGAVQLEILGFAGESYTIQTSTNLTDWATIDTRAADPQGMVIYQHTPPSGGSIRFYRILAP